MADCHGGAQRWTRRRLTQQERTVILQDLIVRHAGNNCQLVSQSPTSATLAMGSSRSLGVHVLLTIFTCGLWVPFWLVYAIVGKPQRHTVHIDEYGRAVWTH